MDPNKPNIQVEDGGLRAKDDLMNDSTAFKMDSKSGNNEFNALLSQT